MSSVARPERMRGQWCRIGLERKAWLTNYARVGSLDFALNAIEILESFKQSVSA